MKVYSVFLFSLVSILNLSCRLDEEKSILSNFDNEIEQIVYRIGEDEVRINDKSKIKEVVQILKKAYELEFTEINKSDSEIVKIQFVTSNPKDKGLFTYDKKNGNIRILSMKKTATFKIIEVKKLNTIFNPKL